MSERRTFARITCWVDGVPKGQPRGRAFVSGGRARIWTPGTAEAWKGDIARAMESWADAAPIAEPVALVAEVFFPRPKRLLRKKDPDGPLPFTATPDWDNVGKAICDALVHLNVLADDKWVSSATVNSWYASRGGPTGALLRLTSGGKYHGPPDYTLRDRKGNLEWVAKTAEESPAGRLAKALEER